jgi:carotenoid cleavage dioxygenase
MAEKGQSGHLKASRPLADQPGVAGLRRHSGMIEPAVETKHVEPRSGGYHARYFEPVEDELDTMDLPVAGQLPPELDGSYVRNGPNPQFPRPDGWQYPYDGDGMLHIVTLGQSRARYRNRYVLTQDLVAERQAGRALHTGTFEVGETPPGISDFDGHGTKNWSNTNVVTHAGRILSLWEGGVPYELTWRFGTVGEHSFDGGLPGAMCAHPKVDPIWDELCWFRYSAEPPYLVYGVVSPRGQISRTVPVDIPRPVVMHEFAVTDQHVVFFDSPAVINPAAAATGAPMVRWEPEHGTRIGVMSRDGEHDRVRWFPVENRYAMHFVNAYTDGDAIVVDYVHRPTFELANAAGIGGSPRLHRSVIELGRGIVSDEMLDSTPVDMPRIDDRRAGLSYRYGYLAAVTHSDGRPEGVGFDTLLRYDVRTNAVVHHRFPDGVIVGEPQFVPRPESLTEGDGWILALTYDVAHDRSELVVIDAEDFAARPVASVQLPRRVPAGLHGTWLPAHQDVQHGAGRD